MTLVDPSTDRTGTVPDTEMKGQPMSTTRTDLGGTDSGQGLDRDESPPGPRADRSGQPSPSPPSLKEVGLFLYLPFLVTSLWTFAFTADDPFITLRYAANLVRGNGLVFNPGQHIQGFTSPLDIVVAAVSYVIPGGDDLFKLKIASLVFGLLALREASLLLYGLTIPRWSKRVACVAMGTSWILSFASGNALETTLVVWLLMALVRRLVLVGPTTSQVSSAAFAFALVLTRIDSLAPLVCMAVLGLLLEDRTLKIWRRIVWFGGAVAGTVLVMLGGLIYFNSALPNTYYAKDLSLGRAFSYGLGYLISPIYGAAPATFPHALAAFVLVVELGFFALGVVGIVKLAPRCSYLAAIVVGQVLYILRSGGDWMPGGRFLAVAIIPLTIVEVLGLVFVASRLRTHFTWRHANRFLLALAAICIIVASFLPLTSVRAPVWSLGSVSDAALMATPPDFEFPPRIAIRENLPKELSCLHAGQLVATSEIGYLGFVRLGLPILDIRGLTDRTIATHTPSKAKYPWGVHEPNLLNAKSVVGREILRQHPVVIATFDAFPGRSGLKKVVLKHQYHLVKQVHFGRYDLAYYSSKSDLDSCLRRV